MKRERMEYRKPYGRGDYELHRGGEGVYWQAGHGVLVRMAAAEHPRDTERSNPLGEVSPLEVWPFGLVRSSDG
jgi:hypothetical protein